MKNMIKNALYIAIVLTILGGLFYALMINRSVNIDKQEVLSIPESHTQVEIRIVADSGVNLESAKILFWSHEGIKLDTLMVSSPSRLRFGIHSTLEIANDINSIWGVLVGVDSSAEQVICISHYTVNEIIKHMKFNCEANETSKNRYILSNARFLNSDLDHKSLIVAYGTSFEELDDSTKGWLNVNQCLYKDMVRYSLLKYNLSDPLDFDSMWFELEGMVLARIRESGNLTLSGWIEIYREIFGNKHSNRFLSFVKNGEHIGVCKEFIEGKKLTFSPPIQTVAKRGYGYLFWPPFIGASHFRIETDEALYIVGELPIIEMSKVQIESSIFDMAFEIKEPFTRVHKLVIGDDK